MLLSSVAKLHQRKEFIEGVRELARLCNWGEKETQGLVDHVWEELVKADNLSIEVMKKTDNYDLALQVWDENMEVLRYWLTLMLGIKINYV